MDFKLRLATLILLLALGTSAYSQICDCVTTGNCPVPINDNGTYNGTLDVTVNGDNDLGVNPITSVCFTITHTWIGDLSVALTSPSGVNYLIMADVNNNYGGCGMQQDNIDVCIVTGNTSPLTNNTEYMCNPGACPAGTCCLTGSWTVPCGGVTDPINGALQAPNCDLNDFNIPGDPANGTWTLTVVDVCNMDTGTLDNFSLTFANGVETCIACDANGGALDTMVVEACYGSPDLLLDIPPNYSGAPPDSTYGYHYVLSQNGVVLEIDSVADLTGQPAGTYQVHGISYLLADSTDLGTLIGMDTTTIFQQLTSTTSPFCGDLSSNSITVTIFPQIPTVFLDTTVCQGNCIMIGNQELCASGIVTLQSANGCDSTIDVTLAIIPPDTTFITETVCQGACVEIGGSQYCAPGPYIINLTTTDGCDSIIDLSFDVLVVNAVISPTNPPALTCADNTVVLDATGTVGTSYIWTGPSGFTSTDLIITVSVPGDYKMTAYDNTVNPPCETSFTVAVANGYFIPDLYVNDPNPTVCANVPFDLYDLPILDNNNTNSVLTFHSGTPATPANQLASSIISISTPTTYYILGTKGFCSDETSVTLAVSDPHSSDFLANNEICISSAATITYVGSASAGANFSWDFDGGIAIPGTGPGPHQVTWPSGGDFTVSLVVEENGCSSPEATQSIIVDEPMTAPQVSCTSTPGSVIISWNSIPGAIGYTVNFTSGHTGTALTDTTYEVANLVPGEIVEYEVIALTAGLCGNTSTQSSCITADCPDVTLTIDPVSDFCREANTNPFALTAVITGDTTNGTLAWSGAGISTDGTFDPTNAVNGANTITLSYSDGVCVYSDEITFNVYDTPVADFTANASACVGDAVTVLYTGTDNPNQTYYWNFDGGDTPDSSGPGPHDVSWTMNGTYTISLFIENTDGCVSETVTQEVVIDAPIQSPTIGCSSTTTSIVFTWNSVPGVVDSIINISPNQTGVLQGNSYTLNGLPPSTQFDFEITLIGNGSCPPVTVTSACSTQDCPAISVDILEPSAFCADASFATTLDVDIIGGSGTGNGTWGGVGINATTGFFNPETAGTGMHAIYFSYEEDGCLFEDSTFVEVVQMPTSDFTAADLICMTDEATVTFTGVASNNANFEWDFDGGVALPGIGPGPHQVYWTTSGSKNITLSVQDGNCSSQQFNQSVQVDQEFSLSSISCLSTTESVSFTWPYQVGVLAYDVEIVGQPTSAQTISDTTFTVDALDAGTQVTFQVTPIAVTSCPITPVMVTCGSDPCWDADIAIQPIEPFCLTGSDDPITLIADIQGAPTTGTATWLGTGIIDPVNGIFDPQLAGEGEHIITFEYQIVNCFYSSETTIKIAVPPVADAGEDITITCWDIGETFRLGGDNTSTGPNIVFEWTTDTGDLPDNSNILRPEITEAGTYTLTATDMVYGCSSSDEIVVSITQDIPEFSLSFSAPDCNGQHTTVAIELTSGGVEPFLFSLNGQPYVETDTFPFLPAGDYHLDLIDGAGCENEADFELEAMGSLELELTANLVGRNFIQEGESIQLLTVMSLPEDQVDSIVWTNADLLSCTGCLDPLATPTETTAFIVTAYMGDCSVSDELIIFVEQSNPIYVPNAFSPNGDKVNDVFQMFPSNRVEIVHSFMVFDRWGDMVCSHQDFLPGDAPANGWDGTLDGKEMNPGIFVWFAEVQFIDGTTTVLKGEVSLFR